MENYKSKEMRYNTAQSWHLISEYFIPTQTKPNPATSFPERAVCHIFCKL